MRNQISRLWRDERGMSMVLVAVGFMAFMAATTLAIDVGMMMTARSQAQSSADAGALAGVTALVRNSYSDRSSTGPAVLSAVNTARANRIMGGSSADVTNMVGPADVVFLNDASNLPNRVQVTVHRTAASSNAVQTLIAGVFGVPTVDIAAVAVAEASPSNAMTCVKPFMIPDRWLEQSNPANSLFNLGTDTYIPAGQDGYTGYTIDRDVGTQLILREGNQDEVSPSFYLSWKMPGDTGGDFYRENIENCNTSLITWGTQMIQEPGSKQGPTIQGIQALIAKDPYAVWSDSCKCVANSAYTSQSPRVFPIPLYDPYYYADGKANGRTASFRVANFLGFFAERVDGSRIYGRVTTILGVVTDSAGPAPVGSFPKAIRLVQ